MDRRTAPQPCIDCLSIFLEQAKWLDGDLIKDRLWALKAVIIDKVVSVNTIVEELAKFFQGTRNVHLQVRG